MWQPGTESNATADWVEAAASLPLAFAQVREDPLIDAELVGQFDRPPRVLMIASGGETAAWLSTRSVASLHLVDLNAAQLNLTRLKLHLLTKATESERLRWLGHESMPAEAREKALIPCLRELGLADDALGPLPLISRFGPDQCGRYEWLFARMRDRLADSGDEISELMTMRDPKTQARRVAKGTPLGDRIDDAMDEVMDLSRLVRIFGPDATANRMQPFSKHFAQQTRLALSRSAAADNPFLHQIFLGSFVGPMWPWLAAPIQTAVPPVRYTNSSMDDHLQTAADQSYDFIHLSNILDWIDPSEANRLLVHARRCLTPGGLVVIRQLNSRLDIPAVDCGLEWLEDRADRLHASDRSFFYRRLHVGTRR